MSRPQATIRLVAAVTIAMVLAVGGCSVSTNDEPQAAGNLFGTFLESTTTTTPTSTPEAAGKTEPLYFLETTEGATRLKFAERTFEMDADIEDVLASLFTVLPDTEGAERPEERGLTSAIPETAVLQEATLSADSTVLIIDVSGLFGSIDGTNLRNALAQIVWTATEPQEIRSVLFRRNGEPFTAIVGNGGEVERAVDRRDYTNLG